MKRKAAETIFSGNVSPESPVDDLRREYQNLLDTAESLLLEHDSLVYHICPSIKASYTVKLGIMECELFQLDMIAGMYKRKAELIQAKINAGLDVSLDEVDAVVNDEFESYAKKIEDLNAFVKESFDLESGDSLSPAEYAAIKSEYHSIVKKIHPDVFPNVTAKEKELFNLAVKAYQELDMTTLKAVSVVIQNKNDIEDVDDPDNIYQEIEKLRKLMEKMAENILRVKQTFPYNKKELLDDENAMKNEKKKLKARIENKKKEVIYYKRKFENLLGVDDVRKNN
ncbi:MAG: hypothetical protein LBR53_01200 [Deltaproteobacteria bacterium]|jgi:hypothetical protein|nr:hypothetical protein [Deltaproteobacteria bacterium]